MGPEHKLFEPRWATQVVRAVLSTVLFHRALGGFHPTTFEVCGVTFSAPAAAEVEAVIAAKTDLITRALLLRGPAPANAARRVRLYVSLYPTPLPPLAPVRPKPRASSSHTPIQRAPSPAVSAPAVATTSTLSAETIPAAGGGASPSPSRSSRRASAAAIAQAAPAAVTSALGWFSASARAALIGTGTGTGAGPDESSTTSTVTDAVTEEQEQEIRMVDFLSAQGKTPFEGWVIDFEALFSEGPDSRTRRPSAGDDKLRAQLHDFLLRTLDFTLRQTAHIPPITTTDLMPYGIVILVDPPVVPFQVPNPIVEHVASFPELHRTLVSTATQGKGPGTSERGPRAASVGARW
ncbi:hypothetical protein JCM3774_005476 [Rhodotorula dairenensis]